MTDRRGAVLSRVMVRVSVVVMPALLVTTTVTVLAPASSCTGKLKLPSALTWTVVPLMVRDLMPAGSVATPLMFWVVSVVVAPSERADTVSSGGLVP